MALYTLSLFKNSEYMYKTRKPQRAQWWSTTSGLWTTMQSMFIPDRDLVSQPWIKDPSCDGFYESYYFKNKI